MYKIAKLTFEAADGAQKDGQLQEQVENYFSALINQGRVAEYMLMQQEGALVAIASLPEADALSEQYDNKYVKRFSEGLSVHWELIGEEVFDSHVCTCQHPSCYLLDGDGEEDGPVFCGDCGGEVPLYRVPADETQEHASLISWQLSYQAMLTLWCESLSDRFTRRQIEHPASALNREGRRLARALEDRLNKPVYLYLENPLGYLKKSPLRHCPACGKPLTAMPGEVWALNLCRKCRLALPQEES